MNITIDGDRLSLRLDQLWSNPLPTTALAAAFGVSRDTLGDRIGDGTVIIRRWGGLVQCRLDTAPASVIVESCGSLRVLAPQGGMNLSQP